jgi:hypothetical protein
MRYGESYRGFDGVEWHHFRVQPIRPKGWVITDNNKVMFAGIPMTKKEADTKIANMAALSNRMRKINNKVVFFQTNEKLPPRIAPIGTVTALINDIAEDVEMDEVYTALAEHSSRTAGTERTFCTLYDEAEEDDGVDPEVMERKIL